MTISLSDTERTNVIVRIMGRGEPRGCGVARLGRRRRNREEWSREEKEEKNTRKRLKISIAEWMER
jgi:hypothetical protein